MMMMMVMVMPHDPSHGAERCLVLPGIEVQLHLWWSTLRLRSSDGSAVPVTSVAAEENIVLLTSAIPPTLSTFSCQAEGSECRVLLCLRSLSCFQPSSSGIHHDPPNADMLRSPIWIMHFSNSAIFSSTLLWSTWSRALMRVRLNLYKETRKSCQSHV